MNTPDLILNVGINDYRHTKIKLKEYYLPMTVWKGMLGRCYSEKHQSKRPTYIGCSVCEEWLLFSNFKKWFDENYTPGYELDKDILVEGNKVYSPDTCRFVPKYINLLVKTPRQNNSGYSGVHCIKGKYRASIKNGDKTVVLGTFDDAVEAHKAYTSAKQKQIFEIVIESFLKNEIMSDIASQIFKRYNIIE